MKSILLLATSLPAGFQVDEFPPWSALRMLYVNRILHLLLCSVPPFKRISVFRQVVTGDLLAQTSNCRGRPLYIWLCCRSSRCLALFLQFSWLKRWQNEKKNKLGGELLFKRFLQWTWTVSHLASGESHLCHIKADLNDTVLESQREKFRSFVSSWDPNPCYKQEHAPTKTSLMTRSL